MESWAWGWVGRLRDQWVRWFLVVTELGRAFRVVLVEEGLCLRLRVVVVVVAVVVVVVVAMWVLEEVLLLSLFPWLILVLVLMLMLVLVLVVSLMALVVVMMAVVLVRRVVGGGCSVLAAGLLSHVWRMNVSPWFFSFFFFSVRSISPVSNDGTNGCDDAEKDEWAQSWVGCWEGANGERSQQAQKKRV
jgi:hypothetical protein